MSAQLPADISAATVNELSDQRDEPEWLRQQRLDALEAVADLEFPSVIQTPGRQWTNLDELDFETLVEPLAQREAKELEAPEEVTAVPFADAVDDHEAVLREHFGRIIDPETNRLTALATALFTTGTVIVVPDGVDADDVKIRTTMEDQSLFNYTLVVTGSSSSINILERQRSHGDEDGDRYYSGLVEVAAGENSQVQYGSLQDFDERTYNYTLKRAVTDPYSTATFVEGNLGSKLTKTEVGTELRGDSSETKIVGAFFGHEDQHFDLDAKVWHLAENTTADLVTRGVIDDRARSVYEGVQDVGSGAWNTSSYQRENTLMLSDESEADASPKLVINNHDTEASHSATVGQIDAEDLFYMTSRGVNPRRARNMLVEGFFVPVLEEIDVEELRTELADGITARLD